MVLTKESLHLLIRLQTQDKVIDTLQAAIDKIPVDIQALRKAVEDEKAKMTEAKNKLTRFQLDKKSKELELGQKEKSIKKHGQELNLVKTNEAYKALQSEIDKDKTEVNDLETSILMLMEEIDKAGQEEKAEAAHGKALDAKAHAEIQVLEARQTELNTQAADQASKRATMTAGIPADVIKIYDHLRKRNKGVALATVSGNMCGVCRITLLPQALIELTRASSLISCEACQRILYLSETPAEKQPA